MESLGCERRPRDRPKAHHAEHQAGYHCSAASQAPSQNDSGHTGEGKNHRAGCVGQADELRPIPQPEQIQVEEDGEDATEHIESQQRRGNQA